MEYEQEQEREDLGVQYNCPDCRSYHQAIASYNYELKQLRDQEPHLKDHDRISKLERDIKALAAIHNTHEHRRG